MTGFLGLPSGAQKRDTNNLNNVFNFALPTAQASQASGTANQGLAASTFAKMLAPGRTAAGVNAAPATNAAIDQSDAARREEASTGTSRGGGTAGANREAGATTTKNIDDIINDNLMQGKKTGASGLASIGKDQTSQADSLLGTGVNAADAAEKGDTVQAKQMADFTKGLLGMFGI